MLKTITDGSFVSLPKRRRGGSRGVELVGIFHLSFRLVGLFQNIAKKKKKKKEDSASASAFLAFATAPFSAEVRRADAFDLQQEQAGQARAELAAGLEEVRGDLRDAREQLDGQAQVKIYRKIFSDVFRRLHNS